MINFNDADADAAYERNIAPDEFELQTSFWALSLLDERDALELHYRAIEDSALEDIADAYTAYLDFNKGEWVD